MKRDPEISVADLILSEADDLIASEELGKTLEKLGRGDHSPKEQLRNERSQARQAKRNEGRDRW